MSQFVHLHVHTEYSLLDGASRISQLVEEAARSGMPALALTDHGVMYGVVDFFKACREQGIKPVLGCEVYVAPRTMADREPRVDDNLYHLVLLAENQEGYRNLMEIVSQAYLEGFYYKPRVDRELLTRHSRGLIALSGCLAGEIPSKLLQGDEEGARDTARFYREIFGAGSFFLELQDHGMAEEQEAKGRLVKLAREMDLPLVATNDLHYVRREDATAHDVLLCIQTGKTLEDENRLRFPSNEFYLKTQEEMAALFPELPEALANTLAIAQRCQVELDFEHLHLPQFPVPGGGRPEEYLAQLCRQGLEKRYQSPSETVKQRLEYELGIINGMDYASYFLVVWDLVRFAKERGILVGPGRGSAAGSLVAYCLGITNVDPLVHGLLFERFLNPERVSMPDIDIDFCDDRRGEIIDYVVKRYGSDRVAQIITFGTMAARGAVRDAGRVYGFPYGDVDRLAKLIPMEPGMTIEKAIASSGQLGQLVREEPWVAQLMDTAKSLEGLPRHASVHAAGVVIAKEPLTNYVPLQKTADGMVTTQFPWETIEELGLLKMDFLGLRTLTVIQNAIGIIGATRGIKIDPDGIGTMDPKTFSLLQQGDTTGVFQLESVGMRHLIKELKPTSLEDVIALVALYRPGPLGSGMVEDYIARKHGQKKVDYLHPELESILKETHGIILYQEQVMEIASVLAGFTLGEADILRRAMGKKKREAIAALQEQFLAGAAAKGIGEEVAREIFDLMAHFAGYGFNKSHSAAYGLVAYQTAYLKANYPVEYMAALLTSVMENTDKVALYIEECRRMGIEILPPDINESLTDFTVVDNKIRFGLAAVKNVGKGAIENIIASRKEGGPFVSLRDFCRRVDLRVVNKRVIESLIKCGAFGSLGEYRARLLAGLDQTLEMAQQFQQEKVSGQHSLLDLLGPDTLSLDDEFPQVPEFSPDRLLALEKETIGLYISGHPLGPYSDYLRQYTVSSKDLQEMADGDQVTLGGILAASRQILTKKGQQMLFATLEDLTGSVEVILFPRVFEQCRHLLAEDAPLLVKGVVNWQETEVKVIADRVAPLELKGNKENQVVYLRLPSKREGSLIERVVTVLENYPGPCPVYIYFKREDCLIQARDGLTVQAAPGLVEELQLLLSPEDIVISREAEAGRNRRG